MFGEQSFNGYFPYEYLFIILVSLMCIFHVGKFTLQKAGIVLICTVKYLSQEASQQLQMSAMCACLTSMEPVYRGETHQAGVSGGKRGRRGGHYLQSAICYRQWTVVTGPNFTHDCPEVPV
ncbi:hypothetical protein ATANTOWER_019622 [Ataeniobius toweri]|uniref:Uncharacterized protein n=1 Tax=Ataeniobius toweri TaxID=208326 RepID=A0ABU7BB87_9TELE|nr:hypothetical protein [Ataeniobius toweri]